MTIIVKGIRLLFIGAASLLLVGAIMGFTGNEDHSVTLEEAKNYTENYRQHEGGGAFLGGAFSRDAFLKILDQAGCTGIRIYMGKGDDGSPNLVMVGVDGDGEDMTGGVIMQRVLPCPPYCASSPLGGSE